MTITKNELIERIEKEKILELPIKDLEDAFNAEFNSKLISIIEDTAIDPLFTKSYSYFDEEDEEEENYGFIKVIYWDKNKVVLCFSTYFSIIAFSNRIILSDLMKILRYLKEGQNILFRVSLTERRIKFAWRKDNFITLKDTIIGNKECSKFTIKYFNFNSEDKVFALFTCVEFKEDKYNALKVLESDGRKKPCNCKTPDIELLTSPDDILSDLFGIELKLKCPECKCTWTNTYSFEDCDCDEKNEDED